MLPQLATETFPSQIFWVVLGFFCVYGVMAFFAVPKLKRILDSRENHINDLLDVAEKLNEKSAKIEKESNELLSKTKQEILDTELRLVEKLEKKSSEEKQRLSEEILENANNEMASLKVSSEEVFKDISSDLDELLDLALQKIGGRKS